MLSLFVFAACNQQTEEVTQEMRTLYPSLYADVTKIYYLNETSREIVAFLPNRHTNYLYYYNEEAAEKINQQSDLCKLGAILPVERENTFREDRLENTIWLLMSNELTEEEKAQGFVNNFPDGFELIGAGTGEGIDLEFNNSTAIKGDSCDEQIMRKQIEKTVNKSRPEIEYVKFL